MARSTGKPSQRERLERLRAEASAKAEKGETSTSKGSEKGEAPAKGSKAGASKGKAGKKEAEPGAAASTGRKAAKGAKGRAGRKIVVWTVFNASYKAVARFPYAQKAEAEEAAERLTRDKKSPHIVQAVKEAG